VTGHLEPERYDRYVLRAMEGQVMRVAVSSPGHDVTLAAWGEDGTSLRWIPELTWCGRLPATQDYVIEAVSSGQQTSYTLTVEISPETLTTPPMILIQPRTVTRGILPVDPPRLHFLGADGYPDIVVPAEHVELAKPEEDAVPAWPFQVAGARVYYGNHYAEIPSLASGVVDLPRPDVLDRCNPPLVSSDGDRLAWICTDRPAVGSVVADQRPDDHFQLVITDGEGRDPRVVWHHTVSGLDDSLPHLVGWQEDGAVIYLAWHAAVQAERRFGYHPGMLAIRTDTGAVTSIGRSYAEDAAVSPDGSWLVQAFSGHPRGEVHLQSLREGAERIIVSTEGVREMGDFTFSPGNAWLAWQEYAPGVFRVRATRLPDGDPFTVYDVNEDQVRIHTLAGWLEPDQLVVVRTEERAVGSSYLITLPSTGPGCKLSSYDFLGVMDEELDLADYPSVAFLDVDVNYTGTFYREMFGYARRADNITHLVLVVPEGDKGTVTASRIFRGVHFPAVPGWLRMKDDEQGLSWALEYLHLARGGHLRRQLAPGPYYVAAAFLAAPLSREEAGVSEDAILYPGITGGGASIDYQRIVVEPGENELQIDLDDGNGWACPWLHVYDGRRFERRTEILRDVRGKRNERTEISRLGPVPVINGSVILRIAEEKEEVAFIDELHVMVDGEVIHPTSGRAAAAKVALRDQDYLILEEGQFHDVVFELPEPLDRLEHVDVSVVVSGFYLAGGGPPSSRPPDAESQVGAGLE
jgi:hypothetical protein